MDTGKISTYSKLSRWGLVMSQLAINTVNPAREKKLAARDLYISCIVPAYNEADNVQGFIESLTQELEKHSDRFEIIMVDDGSQDDTSRLIREIPSKQVKLIKFSRNFGKEIALTAGIEHCQGEVAILIDCDFQHPIKLISDFIHQWLHGYDMVYGLRANRDDESFLKKYLAKSFYRIIQAITSQKIPRNAGDFRLLDRKVINAINACKETDRFMKGLYSWVGFGSLGIPYIVNNRQAGKSG